LCADDVFALVIGPAESLTRNLSHQAERATAQQAEGDDGHPGIFWAIAEQHLAD
jgi:hypothetical protein